MEATHTWIARTIVAMDQYDTVGGELGSLVILVYLKGCIATVANIIEL